MTAKPKDRFPIICAAGDASQDPKTVKSTLQEYSADELARVLIDASEAKSKFQPSVRAQLIIHKDNLDQLFKEKKSPQKEFEEKFYEHLYYKRAPLGRPVDAHSKPKEVDNTNTTFGRALVRSESLYDVVLPNRKADEVWTDFANSHERYVLSHKSYWPSERINRNYKSPAFQADSTFGQVCNVDPTGIYVRRALPDFKRCPDDPVVTVNKTLEEFKKTHTAELGRPRKRYGNFEVSDTTFFGHIKRRDKYCVKQLIRLTDRCYPAEQLFDCLSHLNKVRRRLFNDHIFYFHDLVTVLQKADVAGTGFLPWKTFFQSARSLYAYMDEEKIKFLAKYYKYTNDADTEVNYDAMVKLLMIEYPLPELGRVYPTPRHMQTTYNAFGTDLVTAPSVCGVPTAGRIESYYPRKSGMKVNLEHLSEETSVRALISPNVPSQFGLNHRDFLLPREKDELRKLFKVGNDFDDMWQEAAKEWTSEDGKVSIEAFKAVLGRRTRVE